MNYWKQIYQRDYIDPFVSKSMGAIAEKIAEVCKVSKKTSILDVGTGPGYLTFQLTKFSDNVTGLDNDSYIMKKNPVKKLQIGDATNIPFDDGSFDLVICANTLHHINKWKKAVSELKRVSRKYVVIWEPDSLNPCMLFCALTRKDERLILTRPLSLNAIKQELALKTPYVTNVSNYFFTNVLPDFILKYIPSVSFHKGLGTGFIIVGEHSTIKG